jgi:hypothetical protein
MKQLKLATKWEVKIEIDKRSIQLFDAHGNNFRPLFVILQYLLIRN